MKKKDKNKKQNKKIFLQQVDDEGRKLSLPRCIGVSLSASGDGRDGWNEKKQEQR